MKGLLSHKRLNLFVNSIGQKANKHSALNANDTQIEFEFEILFQVKGNKRKQKLLLCHNLLLI